MINVDPETRQYLKQLVASYEQTIMKLQGRVEELECALSSPDNSVLRDIDTVNQRLEREIDQHHLTKTVQQLEKQNHQLQARVKSLEQQLKVERQLKYYWTERPLDEQYRQTQQRIRQMRRLYHHNKQQK